MSQSDKTIRLKIFLTVGTWLVRLFASSLTNARLSLQKSMGIKDERFKHTYGQVCQKPRRSTCGQDWRLGAQGQDQRVSTLVKSEHGHKTVIRGKWWHGPDKSGFTIHKSLLFEMNTPLLLIFYSYFLFLSVLMSYTLPRSMICMYAPLPKYKNNCLQVGRCGWTCRLRGKRNKKNVTNVAKQVKELAGCFQISWFKVRICQIRSKKLDYRCVPSLLISYMLC